MWLKRTDRSYIRIDSMSLLDVDEDGGTNEWFIHSGGSPLKSGYATEQDARDALEKLIQTLGVVEL